MSLRTRMILGVAALLASIPIIITLVIIFGWWALPAYLVAGTLINALSIRVTGWKLIP